MSSLLGFSKRGCCDTPKGSPPPALHAHIVAAHALEAETGRLELSRNRYPGYTSNWDNDGVKARFGQQRHLLQLGYTDRLLGEYLDRLEAIGDFDRAMVIVAADHGITFVAGEHSRGDTSNVGGIAGVPLLFKEPPPDQRDCSIPARAVGRHRAHDRRAARD